MDAAMIDPGFRLPSNGQVRSAAVLVPLVRQDGNWHLLFTRRTDTVQDHKGQVAFPGGAVEPGDRDRADTALRETWEEIGLPPEDVRILGYMNDFPTISGYMVTPVVGVVPWPFLYTLSLDEVSRVFTIPLSWLADPANYEERDYIQPEGAVHRLVIYYHPYQGEILWGITGRMTVKFLELLKSAFK